MTTSSSKEKCVICGSLTDYEISTHIDLRYGYVEGMGQLCHSCYTGSSRSALTIDERTVMDTPNDMELGRKVRKIFYEIKGIPFPDEEMIWEKI